MSGGGQPLAASYALAARWGEFCYLAHEGDCRVYLYRADRLQCLTRDHTASSERGEQAVARHVLTGSLGASSALRPQEVSCERLGGDAWLLLTSNGLTDVVDESQLAAAIDWASHGRQRAQRLVDRVLEEARVRGAVEDATLVAVHYHRRGPRLAAAAQAASRSEVGVAPIAQISGL